MKATTVAHEAGRQQWTCPFSGARRGIAQRGSCFARYARCLQELAARMVTDEAQFRRRPKNLVVHFRWEGEVALRWR